LKHFISNKDDIYVGTSKFIFTPNVREFERLYSAYFNDYSSYKPSELEEMLGKCSQNLYEDDYILYFSNDDLEKLNLKNFFKREIELAKALNDQIIVKKV